MTEPFEERSQKQIGADCGAYRIAGDPEQRDACFFCNRKNQRMTRANRDAVHHDVAEAREHPRGVIVAAGEDSNASVKQLLDHLDPGRVVQ